MSEATLGHSISADALGAVDHGLAPELGDVRGGEWAQPLPVRPAGSRRSVDREAALRLTPSGDLSRFQRWFRYWFSRTVSKLVMKTWFRIEVVGAERFQTGPCLYAFNHLSWMDPLLFLATFPKEPQLYFYGPKEADLRIGYKNRFMRWTAIPIPFSPSKDDLLTSVRRAQAVFDAGGALVIAPEGSIHVHEGDLFAFQEGAAYLALRAGVPIVPVAITGISWAHFRGRIRVRLGEPIETGVRPTRRAVAAYSARTWHTLKAMVRDDRDREPPGRFERWLTDLFNDWGEGGRAAAGRRRGPDPSEVPLDPIAGE